jgi:hypothetical protein
VENLIFSTRFECKFSIFSTRFECSFQGHIRPVQLTLAPPQSATSSTSSVGGNVVGAAAVGGQTTLETSVFPEFSTRLECKLDRTCAFLGGLGLLLLGPIGALAGKQVLHSFRV